MPDQKPEGRCPLHCELGSSAPCRLLHIALKQRSFISWAVRRAVAEFVERQDETKQAELPFSHSATKE